MSKIQNTKRFGPYVKERRETRVLKCYNCREMGHTSRKCPRPTLECRDCRLLGHHEANSRAPKVMKTSVKLVCPTYSKTQDCCFINSKVLNVRHAFRSGIVGATIFVFTSDNPHEYQKQKQVQQKQVQQNFCVHLQFCSLMIFY